MATNRLEHQDANLKKCYEYDVDWNLLPDRLRRVCEIFGKAIKQKTTTILLGLIVLTSFCMGHAFVRVRRKSRKFWREPVITWIALCIGTGRCKSAFHEFLTEIIEGVQDKVIVKGHKARDMLLPHCTWDKFGDLLAENGARSLGLFDELMSFFSTMNMYSSQRMQLSDTREFQDFLQLFTGKSKTRETVTGNANFKMSRTSFSFFGMTQPCAALPIMQDRSNNAKGFTSRILWFFPEPVFATYDEGDLTEEEEDLVDKFQEEFENFLADLYINGENTFEIEDNGKQKVVSVERAEFILTDDAITVFKRIHDEWEIEVCKKNPHDALIGGIFSRGKSHVVRLAAPIQLLLDEFEHEDEDEDLDGNSQEGTDVDPGASSSGSQQRNDEGLDSNSQEGTDVDPAASSNDHDESVQDENDIATPTPRQGHVMAKAVEIAFSIVKTSLSQTSVVNDKAHVVNTEQQGETVGDNSNPTNSQSPGALGKLISAVLSSPGQIVSFSLLIRKNLFRRPVNDCCNKDLMIKVVDELSLLHFGNVENFKIPSNNSKVYFFKKKQPPADKNEAMVFAAQLADIGMSLPRYVEAYGIENEESELHKKDYNDRQEAEANGNPKKKQRTN